MASFFSLSLSRNHLIDCCPSSTFGRKSGAREKESAGATSFAPALLSLFLLRFAAQLGQILPAFSTPQVDLSKCRCSTGSSRSHRNTSHLISSLAAGQPQGQAATPAAAKITTTTSTALSSARRAQLTRPAQARCNRTSTCLGHHHSRRPTAAGRLATFLANPTCRKTGAG